MAEMILPHLTENLQNLIDGEKEIQTRSVLFLNSDETTRELLEILQVSLNLVNDLTRVYEAKDEKELIGQYLGCRLFNSSVSGPQKALTGYYQGCFIFVRDVLETGFLLDYLGSYPEKIIEWKDCTNRELYRKFGPKQIRKALDDRDGFTEGKRTKTYIDHCEYAAHPSYRGFQLLAPDGSVNIGPFYNEKFLRNSFEELAMRVQNAASAYCAFFEEIPANFDIVVDPFQEQVGRWLNENKGKL